MVFLRLVKWMPFERVCKISYHFRMADAEEKNNSCGTICLKYLLFVFNLLFWVSLCFVLIVISHNSFTPSLSWRRNSDLFFFLSTNSFNLKNQLYVKSTMSSQLAGGAVMAVGIWTLVDKSDYISLLSSSTYTVAAFILIGAGAVVMFTGMLGCCATIREQRGLLIVVREHHG